MAREIDLKDAAELTEQQAHWYKIWKQHSDQIEESTLRRDEARNEMLDGFTADTALLDGKPVFIHRPTTKSGTKRTLDLDLLEQKYPGAREECTVSIPVGKGVYKL
jgi:hypothetical protein